ncbi:18994_t:CDS:2 [Funneliformis geosporum]|uniref:18994_t:CDS:1 n=1 Tax=Funneliformis geosporum TaxID=1117311 RepID=A0A9W4SCS4_9GLOM|nr:18994_t:CDS:2 [Funneliformis geosporum]
MVLDINTINSINDAKNADYAGEKLGDADKAIFVDTKLKNPDGSENIGKIRKISKLLDEVKRAKKLTKKDIVLLGNLEAAVAETGTDTPYKMINAVDAQIDSAITALKALPEDGDNSTEIAEAKKLLKGIQSVILAKEETQKEVLKELERFNKDTAYKNKQEVLRLRKLKDNVEARKELKFLAWRGMSDVAITFAAIVKEISKEELKKSGISQKESFGKDTTTGEEFADLDEENMLNGEVFPETDYSNKVGDYVNKDKDKHIKGRNNVSILDKEYEIIWDGDGSLVRTFYEVFHSERGRNFKVKKMMDENGDLIETNVTEIQNIVGDEIDGSEVDFEGDDTIVSQVEAKLSLAEVYTEIDKDEIAKIRGRIRAIEAEIRQEKEKEKVAKQALQDAEGKDLNKLKQEFDVIYGEGPTKKKYTKSSGSLDSKYSGYQQEIQKIVNSLGGAGNIDLTKWMAMSGSAKERMDLIGLSTPEEVKNYYEKIRDALLANEKIAGLSPIEQEQLTQIKAILEEETPQDTPFSFPELITVLKGKTTETNENLFTEYEEKDAPAKKVITDEMEAKNNEANAHPTDK